MDVPSAEKESPARRLGWLNVDACSGLFLRSGGCSSLRPAALWPRLAYRTSSRGHTLQKPAMVGLVGGDGSDLVFVCGLDFPINARALAMNVALSSTRPSVSAVNSADAPVVLLVEDEFLVRCNIAAYLRDAGYVVVETASGEEAIGFCNSGMSIE
jgi:CheY-like chemotaxis protein